MKYLEKYKQLKPTYEGYSEGLKPLLKSILEANGIRYHLVEGRAKDEDSFKKKVEDNHSKYTDPLNEITDLCGVRIIVYYQTDIDQIDKLINANFEVDKENSVNKSKILKSNEFGYLSNHYIVKINPERATWPEWSLYKDLWAEIQVRTVLQHSWAAISHELQYKSKVDIPDLLKRKLFRLAGLFELADEQFVQVKEKQLKLTEAIANKTEIENIEVYNEINYDTLSHYFNNNKALLDKIIDKGKKAGFGFGKHDDLTNRTISRIVSLLQILKIENINDLNANLNTSIDKSEEYFKLLIKEDQNHDDGFKHGVWEVNETFLVYLLLMSQLSSSSLEEYQPNDWSENVLTLVKKSITEWRSKRGVKK